MKIARVGQLIEVSLFYTEQITLNVNKALIRNKFFAKIYLPSSK
jgi:hypothetical protein